MPETSRAKWESAEWGSLFEKKGKGAAQRNAAPFLLYMVAQICGLFLEMNWLKYLTF